MSEERTIDKEPILTGIFRIDEKGNSELFYTEVYVKYLQQKVEQLENIRKEAIEWVKNNRYYFPKPDDLLNILNKGSEDNGLQENS